MKNLNKTGMENYVVGIIILLIFLVVMLILLGGLGSVLGSFDFGSLWPR